eukprot:5665004-Pyramimonas_sp.AAC.1
MQGSLENGGSSWRRRFGHDLLLHFFRAAPSFDSCLHPSLGFGSPKQAGRWFRGSTSATHVKRGAWLDQRAMYHCRGGLMV